MDIVLATSSLQQQLSAVQLAHSASRKLARQECIFTPSELFHNIVVSFPVKEIAQDILSRAPESLLSWLRTRWEGRQEVHRHTLLPKMLDMSGVVEEAHVCSWRWSLRARSTPAGAGCVP